MFFSLTLHKFVRRTFGLSNHCGGDHCTSMLNAALAMLNAALANRISSCDRKAVLWKRLFFPIPTCEVEVLGV
jgi:hypothetical protein